MTHLLFGTLQRRLGLCASILCFAAAIGAQTPTPQPPAKQSPAAQAPAAQTPAVQAPAAQPAEWKSYRYPTDGFSASYPSAPDMQKRDIPTDAGSFELRSYIAQVDTSALFIGVCDYGSTAAGKDPDEMLEGARDGALKNSNSHLLTEKKITLGIYHGIGFESESDSAHFSARIYMVGAVLYQTLVVSPLDKPFPETARFLDSFQLIAREAKEAAPQV